MRKTIEAEGPELNECEEYTKLVERYIQGYIGNEDFAPFVLALLDEDPEWPIDVPRCAIG